jgi:hypothetical protein
MSGFDLVLGKNNVIHETPDEYSTPSSTTEEDRNDTRSVVNRLAFFARAEFVLVALSVVVAMGACVKGSPRRPSATATLLPLAILAGLSFVSGLSVGAVDVFAPEVHHHAGFWLATLLSVVAILPALVYGRIETSDFAPPGPRIQRFRELLLLWMLLSGMLLLLAAGSGSGLLAGVALVFLAILCPLAFGAGLFGITFNRLTFISFADTVVGGVPLAFVIGNLG